MPVTKKKPVKSTKSVKLIQPARTKINKGAMLIIAAVVAVVGIATLVISHASASTTFTNADITVAPTTVNVIISRKTPNYAMMTADHSGYTEGLLYNTGFTLTNKDATAYLVRDVNTKPGIGIYESSGGLQAGQTTKFHTYVNSNIANGTYTGSAIFQYQLAGSSTYVDGPTINYTIQLVDSYYTDYIKTSETNVYRTVSRKQVNSGGLIFAAPFTLTSVTAGGFELDSTNTNSQELGFYQYSGGMTPGETVQIQPFINPAKKANGVYTGSYTLSYNDPNTGNWTSGPVIKYHITLVDSMYTDFMTVRYTTTNITLSRAQKDPSSGLIYGTGPTIINQSAGGFAIKYNAPTQGVGYASASGGLQPNTTTKIKTYINPNKPNGIYSGSAVLQYYDKSLSKWMNGPTLNYTITLTD